MDVRKRNVGKGMNRRNIEVVLESLVVRCNARFFLLMFPDFNSTILANPN